MRNRKIYISGPVTGIPGGNLAAFLDAAAKLMGAGYKVIIPHLFVSGDASHEDAMRACIRRMCAWDVAGVAQLDGWEDSDGARLEADIADECGIEARPLEEWLS